MPVALYPAPHPSHLVPSLDIGERQVVIHYADDPHFQFHSRILLVQVSGATWIVVTPTGDIQVEDFSTLGFYPVGRASLFGADILPCFGFSDLGAADLAGYRARAAALAGVLGVAAPAATGDGDDGKWLWGDPAHSLFGEEVPLQLLGAVDAVVMKGFSGLGRCAEDGVEVWRFMEKVEDDNLEAWLAEKPKGDLLAKERVRRIAPKPFPVVLVSTSRGRSDSKNTCESGCPSPIACQLRSS